VTSAASTANDFTAALVELTAATVVIEGVVPSADATPVDTAPVDATSVPMRN